MESTIYTLFITVEAKPETQKELKKLLEEGTTENRKAKGCIEYRLHQDLNNPNQFALYENWTSKEAHLTHAKEPEVKTLMSHINDLTAKPFQVIFAKELMTLN